MKLFSSVDFQVMPWKNGGGSTIELVRFPEEKDGFYFRMSQAKVEKDGPFSLFPGIDRYLMILEGEGCVLNDAQKLTRETPAYFFSGDINVDCKLINGPVTDFNVMIDRTWGKASVEKFRFQERSVFQCKAEMTFFFNPDQMILCQLEKSEAIELSPDRQWIVVSVDRLI